MQSIFFLLFALGFISAVSTYQCYVCSNTAKGGCSDPFDSNSMVDDDKKEASAGGACLKSKLETKGGSTVVRSIITDTSLCLGGKNGCKKESASGVTAHLCCCTSNLCNGVSTLRQPPLTIAFLTITTLAMFIYRFF